MLSPEKIYTFSYKYVPAERGHILTDLQGPSMTEDTKIRLTFTRPSWQRTTGAVLLCAPLAATPLSGFAQQASAASDEVFRLAPIIVNARVAADDDANSVVAKELWVGGKVATSVLDTPASVSVITQKEIEQRSASTTEEVL